MLTHKNLDQEIFEEYGERAVLAMPEHRRDVELFSADIRVKSFPAHEHEGFVIGVIERGAQEFRYRGKTHRVGSNSITMLNPGEMHTGRAANNEGLTYRTIHFPSSVLSAHIHENFRFSHTAINSDPSLAKLVTYNLDRMNDAHESITWDRRFQFFIETLCQALPHNEAFTASNLRLPDRRLREVLSYVDKNLELPLKIRDLAEKVGLSDYHFIRKFKESLGFTPHAYIQSRRTAVAKQMLMKLATPADVAAAVGFCDQSHLSRWISSSYGATPGFFGMGI